MVNDINEALEMAGAKKSRFGDPRPGDALNPLDQAIIGTNTVRLEIPLTADRHALRRAADLLRGYANRIDVLAREPSLSDRTLLFVIRDEGRTLNGSLRQTAGRDVYSGRPRTKAEQRAARLSRGKLSQGDRE
jgi:hypothetical protein